MQRLFDDLISDVRTVEIAGVNVVHARGDSLAKNRDRTRNITWRPPHALVAILSGELHGAITHAIYSQRCARERKAAQDSRSRPPSGPTDRSLASGLGDLKAFR
jgi:hypothetical protein